jgi:ribonuclease P protein component
MQSRVSRNAPRADPTPTGNPSDLSHETYLPSIEDATRPHPWLSRAHENPWWPRCDQRAPCQGAQAFGGLKDRPAAAVPTAPSAGRRPLQLAWVALGGDALKALLSAPTVAKTAHFVLQAASERPVLQELPTGVAPDRTESVDNSLHPAPPRLGLALVVPKRHAKRAATRNLVKRQMREVMRPRADAWSGCRILIRQRGAFDPRQFPSAASDALRAVVRKELELLLAQAGTR